MKKLALATAFAAAASTASAGNLEPVVEEVVVVEEAGSSASNVWVPLLLIALVAIGVAADS